MRIASQQNSVRDLWESFDEKFNASNTPKGRKVANREFASKIMSLIESGKIRENDLSIKELYEELVVKLEENLDSSAFPVITSQLISSKVIAAYEAFPKVGLSLVTVIPSKLKEGRIAGWQAIGTVSKVIEREAYREVIPPDQKFVAVKHEKVGGLLSLTREDITFDQTGELLRRAAGIGEEAARFQDEEILKKVTDKDSDGYNKTTLYSSGNSNLLTGASTVLGTASFEQTHVALTGKKDERDKPIWVHNVKPVMLVGATLEPTAFKLKNNEYGPQGTANLDKNFAFNRFDYLVNPYQDSAISTVAWFYGNFKRQFAYEEVWPLEVYSRVGQDSEEGFKNDLIQQFKAGYYGGAGAFDYRFVYKVKGAA